ncbi:hypothetical protein Ahy_A03g013694 isoform A [Arachis hypogaea]|uniref:Uncharacterized protein n=1 Tax=Arachis hypogaea TaxID=3818 RepID=A0A445DW16_ARAHY|nr:hypothetical protein Ahy_A03g013694 isoform A [Arachis hypogaea]
MDYISPAIIILPPHPKRSSHLSRSGLPLLSPTRTAHLVPQSRSLEAACRVIVSARVVVVRSGQLLARPLCSKFYCNTRQTCLKELIDPCLQTAVEYDGYDTDKLHGYGKIQELLKWTTSQFLLKERLLHKKQKLGPKCQQPQTAPPPALASHRDDSQILPDSGDNVPPTSRPFLLSRRLEPGHVNLAADAHNVDSLDQEAYAPLLILDLRVAKDARLQSFGKLRSSILTAQSSRQE